MADTYSITRLYMHGSCCEIKTGLTLEQAQAYCRDPETSSRTCSEAAGIRRTQQFGPWFDSYEKE